MEKMTSTHGSVNCDVHGVAELGLNHSHYLRLVCAGLSVGTQLRFPEEMFPRRVIDQVFAAAFDTEGKPLEAWFYALMNGVNKQPVFPGHVHASKTSECAHTYHLVSRGSVRAARHAWLGTLMSRTGAPDLSVIIRGLSRTSHVEIDQRSR